MRITFEETLGRKDWLHKELMASLTGDVITAAYQKQSYEVKLLVDGVELEPNLLNKLLTKVEYYIDKEAKVIFEEKYTEMIESLRNKFNNLEITLKDVQEKIAIDHNVEINNED